MAPHVLLADIIYSPSSSFDFPSLLQDAFNAQDDEEVKEVEGAAPVPSQEAVSDEDAAMEEVKAALAMPSPPGPGKEKPQSHAHRKRAWKRLNAIAQRGHKASARTIDKQVKPARPQKTKLVTKSLPTARGAYSATSCKPPPGKKMYSLKVLQGSPDNFKLVEWDGRKSIPILDRNDNIIAVLAGQPDDPAYALATRAADQALVDEAGMPGFDTLCDDHRRGRYPSLSVGISYGKGQRVPSRFKNSGHETRVNRLMTNPAIKRLAGFGSSAFSLWAPKLYDHYSEHLDQMYKHLPHLEPNFNTKKSIFPATTFNFGPAVSTVRHRDNLNCPYGWCAIQALGDFNPKEGGHLILWDLKLIIEFPPGSTILIPSATVEHSNLPVRAGERRHSITQYCAGGIFRWVDNGFRTEEQLKKADPKAYEIMQENKEGRWEEGLKLFSKLADLL